MLIKFYHWKTLDLLFSAEMQTVPRFHEIVVRGERPIDYRVYDVVYDVGPDASVKVYLQPGERKYRK